MTQSGLLLLLISTFVPRMPHLVMFEPWRTNCNMYYCISLGAYFLWFLPEK